MKPLLFVQPLDYHAKKGAADLTSQVAKSLDSSTSGIVSMGIPPKDIGTIDTILADHSRIRALALSLSILGLLGSACGSGSSQSAEVTDPGKQIPESPAVSSEPTEEDETGGLDQYDFPDEGPDGCTEEISHISIVEDTSVFNCGLDEIIGFDLAANETAWSFDVPGSEVDDSWQFIGVAGKTLGLVVTESTEPVGLSAGETTVQFVLVDAINGGEISRHTMFEGSYDDRDRTDSYGGIARTADVFVVSNLASEGDRVSGFDATDGSQLWTDTTTTGVVEVMGSVYGIKTSSGSGFTRGEFFDARTNEPISGLEKEEFGLTEYGDTIIAGTSVINNGTAVFDLKSGQSYDIELTGIIVPYINGFLVRDDGSLTFLEPNGQIRWATDPGVVEALDFYQLGSGPPWIVVTNSAGEEIVIDALSGEPAPEIDLNTWYYGDWTFQGSDSQFSVQRQ